MSCENNTPLASRYDDLFLRSSGPFYDIANRQVSTGQQSGLGTPQSLLDELIASGRFDTGSGGIDLSQINITKIFDENGNVRPGAASDIVFGAIDPAALGGDFDETSPIFDEIKSFVTKLDLTDPFEKYGRETIVEVTDALNEVLSDLGNLDDASESGQASADVNLNDYPSLTQRVGGGSGGGGGGGSPSLSYTEVGDFLSQSETDPQELLGALQSFGSNSQNSATLNSAFSNLDFYFLQNLGELLAQGSGLCGKILSIIELIIQILELLDVFVRHIDMARSILASIFDLDFIKLVIQIAQRLVYLAIKKLILETIEQIYEQAVAKLLALLNAAQAVVAALTGQKHEQFDTLEEAYIELKEFYSKENLKRFQEKIEEFLDRLALEFERFTLENMAQLIERLCNFLGEIQQILFGPLIAFQAETNTAAAEDAMMRSISLTNMKRAIEYGALRLSLADRKALQQQAREALNARSASFGALINGASTDYATAPEMTEEEIKLLFGIEGGISPYFKVSGTAKEPYRPESPDIKNIMRTKKIVLARLIRMSKRTGIEYRIIEAFLLKKDEENRGASNNTIMQSGSAIKIKIEGGFEWVAKTIISASQEGFVGIGVGNDYIHLDVGPRELTWVDGFTPGFTDTTAVADRSSAAKYVELLERHKRKEFVKKVL